MKTAISKMHFLQPRIINFDNSLFGFKNMKIKLLNIGLIVTSLLGYLEWGGGNSAFFFQVEWKIFTKIFTDPNSVLHPFTIIPLAGQILFLIALFKTKIQFTIIQIGIVCLSTLFLFLTATGILSSNMKVVISTMPFLLLGLYTMLFIKKMRKTAAKQNGT